MDGRFSNQPPFINDQDDSENSPENSADSPRSGMFHDTKMASINSPKRSRRAIQKRVVSVPINDVEGSKLKGESSFPPSDSWAWRKYGQKPIKGSPYPRGYYRCSSSKGCPAKKQVERSRVDPNMLVVTYSCEHNHPWPAARNNHAHRNAVSLTAAAAAAPTTRSSSKAAAADSEDAREAEAEASEFFRSTETRNLRKIRRTRRFAVGDLQRRVRVVFELRADDVVVDGDREHFHFDGGESDARRHVGDILNAGGGGGRGISVRRPRRAAGMFEGVRDRNDGERRGSAPA